MQKVPKKPRIIGFVWTTLLFFILQFGGGICAQPPPSDTIVYKKGTMAEQFLLLTNIHQNENGIYTGEALVMEADAFHPWPHVQFKGRVNWLADAEELELEGQIRISTGSRASDVLNDNWIEFVSTTSTEDFVIPIHQPSGFRSPIMAGLIFVPPQRRFYTMFLNHVRYPDFDQGVLTANDFLSSDPATGELVVTSSSTEVRLQPDSDYITVKGPMAFPQNFAPKTTELEVAGSWTEDHNTRAVSTDLTLGLHLNSVPKKAWEALAEQFQAVTASQPDMEIAPLLSPKEYSLLLSGVDFNWDKDRASLYSNGTVGLVSIQGQEIRKQMNSTVEYNYGTVDPEGGSASDTLTLVLQWDESNWIFLQAYDNKIGINTSDVSGCNAEVSRVIQRKRKPRRYELELNETSEKDAFLQRHFDRYGWYE